MIHIDLSGKVAVITGASGELGRVMTRTLAQAGASVAIVYHRQRERAQALQSELARGGFGGRSLVVQADVTDRPSVFALRDAVKQELGPADIIVNNAVIQYEWTSVLKQPAQDYQSQFQSSVLHNVFMAQAFVPDMIARRWGRVIAINTECTMQARPSQSAYISGKAGMDRVLRVLAREVGEHQITVNQVAPGWMISDRCRAAGREHQPEYEKNVPLRRRGCDQDIANAVVFLASDLAGFITGAYLPVCGGNVMPCL